MYSFYSFPKFNLPANCRLMTKIKHSIRSTKYKSLHSIFSSVSVSIRLFGVKVVFKIIIQGYQSVTYRRILNVIYGIHKTEIGGHCIYLLYTYSYILIKTIVLTMFVEVNLSNYLYKLNSALYAYLFTSSFV